MTRWPVLAAGAAGFALFAALGEKWWGVGWACLSIFAAFKVRPAPALERGFSPELRQQLRERDGVRCFYCGRLTHYDASVCPLGGCDADYEADHVDPYSEGGSTTLENGVVSCRRCNRWKSARPVDEFIEDPDGDGVPGL